MTLKKPKISVLGIGYVGLCTAVGFASKKNTVIASTHDAEKAEGGRGYTKLGLDKFLCGFCVF